MEQLFVTDLDGTLLDSHVSLTQYSTEKLNELIGKGIPITYATSRSYYTASKLFAVLDRGIKALQKAEASVLLPVDGKLLRLPVSRIRYVEAFGHGVTVSTWGGAFCAKIPIPRIFAVRYRRR